MKFSEKKIKEMVVEKRKQFLDDTHDIQNRALIRRLFIRLGYLVYLQPDSSEITRVKSLIDDMLDEHGIHLVKKMNASKLLDGEE